MDSDFDHLPLIPHEHVTDVDCYGCLMVGIREDKAEILCNECGAVIRTVPVGEIESTMLELSTTDIVCSARCTHCGLLNTFPHDFLCCTRGRGGSLVPTIAASMQTESAGWARW